jgi:hypothetical protein
LYNTYNFTHFQGGDAKATLSQVFIFVTGASCPPPLGFDEPVIEFTQGEFPKGNTCAPILYLPLGHNDYATFKSKFDFGVLNLPHFGHA